MSDLEQVTAFYKETLMPFVFHDIQIAIDGKANYLAALGLVCYTEFLGGLTRGNFNAPGCNFKAFFSRLGEGYRDFGQKHDVYSIYRCGLVHEYMIKAVRHPATVFMYDTVSALRSESSIPYSTTARAVLPDESVGTPIGVGIKKDGGYYFVVETYFRDFKKAAQQLLAEIKTDRDALRLLVKALDSVLRGDSYGY